MDLIRDAIEWFANDGGSTLATLFPYLLIALLALWLLSLLIGYLRVSQVGLRDGGGGQPAMALPAPVEGGERPRGVAYCAVDNLQFPSGARFCPRCERDLLRDCVNCGATLSAADASCYRCGTPTGVGETPLLS